MQGEGLGRPFVETPERGLIEPPEGVRRLEPKIKAEAEHVRLVLSTGFDPSDLLCMIVQDL